MKLIEAWLDRLDHFFIKVDRVLGYQRNNSKNLIFFHYYRDPIYNGDLDGERRIWGYYDYRTASSSIFVEFFRRSQRVFKYHREDGPAYTLIDYIFTGEILTRKWYLGGHLHRMDGPAIEDNSGEGEYWYQCGRLHRSNGPAVVVKGRKEWWLRGVKVTVDDVWEQLTPQQKEAEMWRLNEWRD